MQSVTSRLTGDSRPKQFCRLLGQRTLLEETRDRVLRSVAPHRTITVTTAHHRAFYTEDLLSGPSHRLVEQPTSRGTAAAIALALGRISGLDPAAILGIFPSDHYYREPGVLTHAVDLAFLTAAMYPDHLVLVGASAERAESDYGWIVPGGIVPTPFKDNHVFSVDGFSEKPDLDAATALLDRGGLWNTFIAVGSVKAFSTTLHATLPDHERFSAHVAGAHSVANERRIVQDAYATLEPACFSSSVLGHAPMRCLTVRMTGSGWMDIGRPNRLAVAQARSTETTPSPALFAHALAAVQAAGI